VCFLLIRIPVRNASYDVNLSSTEREPTVSDQREIMPNGIQKQSSTQFPVMQQALQIW